MNSKKVLLIGWDAADWEIILPMVEAGEMPTLSKLINQGTMGNLSTLEPAFSPMLWTSIATGKRPDKHGILGFTEPRPDGQGIRPVSSLSRKCKAIWNILMQNGFQSNVIGWWPSHPAEPIDGIMVSDLFHKIKFSDAKWEMPKQSVHPSTLYDLISHLRVHPFELSAQHLHPFIPELQKIDQDKDSRVSNIGNLIAEAASIQSAATWALENKPWDFAAVYFDTIDHFCHGFMQLAPPKTNWVSDDDFLLYKEVVSSAYKMMDQMLFHLLNLTNENTTVILVSDHGFKSGNRRTPTMPFEPAGPADHHRSHGIFCISGPGIRKDEWIYGPSLLDITPTILTIFGLPVGQDMDGTPLTQVFSTIPAIKVIKSWEEVNGSCGRLEKSTEEDTVDSAAAIRQLIDLGYIEDPGDNEKDSITKTIDELNYNKARVFMGSGRFSEAAIILEPLIEKHLIEGRITLRLIDCYRELGHPEKGLDVLHRFREQLNKYIQTENENNILEKIRTSGVKLSRKDALIVALKKYKQAHRDLQSAILSEAHLLHVSGNNTASGELLNKHPELLKNSVQAGILSAKLHLANKEYKPALQCYQDIVKNHPDYVPAIVGLSSTYCKLRSWNKAADAALDAINYMYYNPSAHYYLGLALFNMKKYENAAMALETCLRMNKGIGKAKNLLFKIYTEYIINPQKIDELDSLLSDNENELPKSNDVKKNDNPLVVQRNKVVLDKITYIVSGLPRSGTSLMMQILEAGGMQVLTDNSRKPDESNPKGYFELDAVKGSSNNMKWIKQADNKVVKVVSHLLKFLPANRHYKIIFMNRNLKEIIISQQKMAGKENSPYPMMLEDNYKKHIIHTQNWIKLTRNIDVLNMNYHEVIENPSENCRKIAEFMDLPLSIEDMSAVVDKNLYRNRIK